MSHSKNNPAGFFIREKKIDCNSYREVDIIPRTDDAEMASKSVRSKQRKVTVPTQANLNDKNSKRYLAELANGNFTHKDFHITCTYAIEPDSIEKAERVVKNYLRRIAYRRKKLGLSPLKYILITEYKGVDGEKVRVHHHIIINGGIPREELEFMWTTQRINWGQFTDTQYREGIKLIGYVNADRLQFNENGIEALCNYVTKARGKKRWTSSKNLTRPVRRPDNDTKYTPKKVENLAKSTDCGRAFFEKRFPKYQITEIKPVYYDKTGWHIYIKMWKREDNKAKT